MAVPDTYNCVYCNKKRVGRFTRAPNLKSSRADRPAFPMWACYTCLPFGEGAGENKESEMPAKAKTPEVLPAPKRENLIKTKEEGLAVIPPIQADVLKLEITDPETYAMADTLLGRIRDARKMWGDRMEKVIRPIRQGLDELYSLNRDVDKPLDTLEGAVKVKMRFYKLEEARQIAEAKAAQEQETRRLEAEAAAKLKAAELAKTPQMRGKLQQAAAVLQVKATAVAEQEAPTPTMGHASSSRGVKKWRIGDKQAFIAAVADGTLPLECVTENTAYLNQQFKADPEGFPAWPGLEVFDDIQIVGR